MLARLRLAAIAAAVFSASAATAAPTIGTAKSVAVGLSETSEVRAVVGLRTGGALYAISDDKDVLVRPVSAAGKVGPAKSLTTASRGEFDIQEAAMALLKNGDVVVAWVATPGPRSAVFVRIVKANGDAVSSELQVSDGGFTSSFSVSVAALSNGGFAVAWRDLTNDGASTVRARAFDQSANPKGFTATIAAPGKVAFSSPAIATMGSGFLMAYARLGDGAGIMTQRFTSRAKASGAAARIDASNSLRHEDPSIAARIGGGFAVLWRENAYGAAGGLPIVYDATLKGRFLASDGTPGKRFAIEDAVAPKSIERSPAIVDTSAGLLAAWHVSLPRSGDRNDNDLRGTLVQSSGSSIAPVRLTRKGGSNEIAAQLSRLADGRAALGFTSTTNFGSAGPYGAFAAFLKVSP